MTDKKSEVRWDRQDDGWRVSKQNAKVPVLSLLTSESDINRSQGCPHFCVWIYFSNEKLTNIYQVKSK